MTSVLKASMIFAVLSSSIGTGAGPTPALWQAAPQKGWSPKNGTMKVGLPVAGQDREGADERKGTAESWGNGRHVNRGAYPLLRNGTCLY